MKISTLALASLCLLAACEGGPFGSSVDDDGCTKGFNCKREAGAGQAPKGHDPDSGDAAPVEERRLAPDASAAARQVIGVDNISRPECFSNAYGYLHNSDSQVRVLSWDGTKECSGIYAFKNGKVISSANCQALSPTRLQKATFFFSNDVCTGDQMYGGTQDFDVVEQLVDAATQSILLTLSPTPPAFYPTAKLGSHPRNLTNNVDTMFSLFNGGPGKGNRIGLACKVNSWAGHIGYTDCDTLDPTSAGGQVLYDQNGCIVVPGVPGCSPGTGSTTPNSLWGRVAGMVRGPSGTAANTVISMDALVGPNGPWASEMFPGNFRPLPKGPTRRRSSLAEVCRPSSGRHCSGRDAPETLQKLLVAFYHPPMSRRTRKKHVTMKTILIAALSALSIAACAEPPPNTTDGKPEHWVRAGDLLPDGTLAVADDCDNCCQPGNPWCGPGGDLPPYDPPMTPLPGDPGGPPWHCSGVCDPNP